MARIIQDDPNRSSARKNQPSEVTPTIHSRFQPFVLDIGSLAIARDRLEELKNSTVNALILAGEEVIVEGVRSPWLVVSSGASDVSPL
jgi:hypothetical protein